METVNKYVNAASSAASTALWGENQSPNAQQAATQHGDEPISGVQGQGVATDPYDAGNREDQPGAIASEANTAINAPVLDGKQVKPQEGTFTTHADPSTGVKSSENVNNAFTTPTAASTAAASTSTSTSQPTSSDSAESTNSNADSTSSNAPSETEQRSTSQSEEGESSGGPRPAHAQGVSKEALEGPQGPAPRPAEEFEDESKGKKGPMQKEMEKTSSSESKQSETSTKSPSDKSENSSQGSGKHSPLSRAKDSVKKHLHH